MPLLEAVFICVVNLFSISGLVLSTVSTFLFVASGGVVLMSACCLSPSDTSGLGVVVLTLLDCSSILFL